MVVKFAIEKMPNKEFAKIHFSEKIPKMSWLSKDKMSASGHELQTSLQAIDGVVEVTCYDGHSVSIQRGGAFTFEDVTLKVLQIISAKLGFGNLEEVEAYR